jgi:sterol desaturase/sphingolipid hydroxylase (fatty acid hydroxylase superfamily)
MNYKFFMLFVVLFEVFFYLLDYFYLSRRKNIPNCYQYSRENFVSSLFLHILFFHTKMINGLFVMLSYKFLSGFNLLPAFAYERNLLYFIVLFLGVDFSFWFVHLLSHKYKWLWFNHLAHHASSRFNYAVNLRLGFVEVFNFLPVVVIFALLGFPEKDFFYVFLINIIHMGWAHTSFPKIKWLEYIFVTPSNHRVHHYKGKLGGRNNYGGTFIIWDRLFGTYREEDPNVVPEFGVSGVEGDSIRPIAESLPGFFNLKEKSTFQLPMIDLAFAVLNFVLSGIILILKFDFKTFSFSDKLYFAFIIIFTWLSAVYVEFQLDKKKIINFLFRFFSLVNIVFIYQLMEGKEWTLPKNPTYIFVVLTFILFLVFTIESLWQKTKENIL